MIRLRKIPVLFVLLLVVTACQKRKYPEEKVQLEKEDIYFDGNIDNEPVALKIGAGGYYCYSSYKQRTDSIYIFEGELKKFDCDPCPRSLRLELSDYEPRLPGSSVPVDSVFRKGNRSFIPGMSKISTIRFIPQSNKEISSLRWDLSNGASSQDAVLKYEFLQQGPHTVSLTVRTKSNCESMVINKIFVGGENSLFACSILTEQLQNNNSVFKATFIGGKAPFRYTWSFGDGSTSNLSEPTHDYKFTGSYPVRLLIIDAEDHVCESNYIHVTASDKSSCATNMLLSLDASRSALLNGAKIQWTDASNTVLRSDNMAQPEGSYFEIVNSQAYEANEKGEAGRLLTIRFNVLLSNGSRKVWFKSESTAIAVTYK